MDTIIPFTPTNLERQHPLAQEYQNSAGNLSTANLQEDPDRRGRSGSKWGIKEVNAVRAVPLVDLEPTRIVPARFFPADDNEIFRNLYKQIRAAEIDDIKEFDADKFQDNKYISFFNYLAELSTTNTSEESIMWAHRRNTSFSSVTTELSTSSNEESNETASTAALRDFVNFTLLYMGRFRNLAAASASQSKKNPHLSYFADQVRFKFSIGGIPHEAVNDGQVAVNFSGSNSGSDRKSYLSVINLECKPRNAGGLKRPSGEPEVFSPIVFAQETAEMIGAVFAQEHLQLPFRHESQESFVLGMHGTLFYVTTAHFPADYIQYLRTSLHPGVGENYLWVRRSVHFDLKRVNDRGQALRFLWALFIYVASGEAKVNIVSSAIQQAGV